MSIKVEANPGGGHEYQNGGIMQDGWAFWDTAKVTMPESMPYVDIITELVTYPAITNTRMVEVDGEMVEKTFVVREEYAQLEVVSATAREIPEEVSLDLGLTPEEQLRADVDYLAIMTGVEL